MKAALFRLGLIGAGRMGRTHLRALAGASHVAVTAVVEPDAGARAAIGAAGLAAYEDVGQFLDAGQVDGVLIAAPSDLHVALVSQFAAAGLPILCEKPCGLTTAEIGEVAAAIERHGVRLQVGYWRRYVPALQALRDRIERGELGTVHLLASYQWDGQPPGSAFRARSGGILRDMAVHEFDQVRWLSGQEIRGLSAAASPVQEEPGVWRDVDSAHALASLTDGSSAFVSVGRYFPGGDMARIEVFGSLDAVRCDFLDPRDGEQAQLDALRRQAEAFATFARGGGSTGASIRDAAAALAAAERAAEAILSPGAWAGGCE